MTAPAHTYQRLIENAVVTTLKADSTVNQAYKDIRDADYSPAIVRAYDWESEVDRLAIVVHARDLTNAMLGATGRSAQWRVTLVVAVMSSKDHDKGNDNADRVQGACERWLYGLTPSTLNTALGVGSVITIHGITSAELDDAQDDARETLARYSAVTLHFGTT